MYRYVCHVFYIVSVQFSSLSVLDCGLCSPMFPLSSPVSYGFIKTVLLDTPASSFCVLQVNRDNTKITANNVKIFLEGFLVRFS